MRSDHLKEYIKIAINNKSIKQKRNLHSGYYCALNM